MRKLHGAVLLLCVMAAAMLFRSFLVHPRALWVELAHDRNGHYNYGLVMAEAVEHGQPREFFSQLDKGKEWPPVHGLLVVSTQIFSHNDWRLAVLPSLAGWVLTLVCVWYTAQKITAPAGAAVAGGLVALIFAALSPDGRAYATDIMLESLGAGLTMLALACHARAVEDWSSTSKWRALGLALTLLFFEKYNYWLIAVVALGIPHAGPLAAGLRARLRGIDWKTLLLAQIRELLNWVALAVALLAAWVFARGPAPLHIFGRDVSVYPPHNIITAAYAVLFLRVALGIRRARWKPAEAWQGMLLRWHVLPVAVWFLLPQRLGMFFWYLSPANTGEVAAIPLAARVKFYWDAFEVNYNAAWWMGFLAIVLACVALARFKAFGPGGRAVLVCMLLGAALNIMHPNDKSRFMHSWLPAFWTAAGAGAAVLLGKIKMPRRALVAGTCLAALAAAGGRAAWIAPPSTLHVDAHSDLNLSDAWLAEVAGSPRVAFFCTQPGSIFMAWTFTKNRGSHEGFEWPKWQEAESREKVDAGFDAWIASTQADAVVFLDVPPESPLFYGPLDQLPLRQRMDALMAGQAKFTQPKYFDFPMQGCTVTVWHAARK